MRLRTIQSEKRRVRKKIARRQDGEPNGQSFRLRVMPQQVENGTVLDGVRRKVFLDRYSLKDEAGNPIEEYPEQMWRRVARGIAQAEKTPQARREWEEKFYRAMEGFKFVPGGRILSGAGTGYSVTFYNCYVLPSPHDSRGGIMENLREMVDIMATGGGVGINLSSLRPRGSRVKKVNGFSSGPMNWAELYSVATHDVIQQGGTRRGALMLMLWDWHPDIEEFITVKRDLTRIVGANLSICVSDRFMRAVKDNEDWPLLFPDLDDPDYDKLWDGIIENWIEAGKKVKVYKTIKASYLWDLICEAAWASAEPGLHFMERTNKWSNTYYFNRLISTNPCGEEPLSEYGVCNLGSLNLSAYVDEEEGKMDYESLAEHARVASRFLDDVIDSDIYIFKGVRETQLNGERRFGLGTMGLGDALIKMKVRYGSEQSLPIIEKIYKVIRDSAYEASVEIAKEKGSFPKFIAQKYLDGYFIKQLPQSIREGIKKHGIRNSYLLMQAPTGSTSLLSGTTSGIEPVYEFSFIRRDRLGEHKIYHLLFEEWRKEHPNEEPPPYFVSANDLTPEDHVRVQAAVQKYVDASISKTVNAPATHTVEDVKKLYTQAYELGCKGITYMRDGSRPGVLSREDEKPKEDKEEVKTTPVQEPQTITLRPRPFKVSGSTYRIVTPVGSAFITINEEDGEPLEVFINVGKAGSDVAAMAEALGRLVSTSLRLAGDLPARKRIEEIVAQLSGIGGRRSVGFGKEKVRSLPDAVALALATHYGIEINGNGKPNLKAGAVMAAQDPDPTPAPASFENSISDLCPSCGAGSLVYEEGCVKCYACGYSEC